MPTSSQSGHATPSPVLITRREGRQQHFDALPRPLTSLVGREQDIAAVSALVGDHDVRIVTLLGPGGVGKTRLALRVAESVAASFANGVAFVALAPVTNPDFVLGAIAHALDVQESSERSVFDHVKALLQTSELLLLLDNFEHVLAAASVISDLLQSCPGVTAMVTSRAPLHLYGEHVYRVPLLTLPANDCPSSLDLIQSEATRLFLDRARAIRPDFGLTDDNAAVVSAICRRLDGLPLAIELAVARLSVLTPQAILDRLERRLPLLTGGRRDAPARQQTLRETIAWSYDLLSAPERRLFRRLAVFVGSFSLDAVEEGVRAQDHALGDENGESPDASSFEVLASLVDKSLVQRIEGSDHQPRFGMLASIREFGLEQLDLEGETGEVHRRWLEWYVRLVGVAEPRLLSPDQGSPRQAAWLERLDTEYDNLRAALGWAIDQGLGETALRLVSSLWPYWRICHHAREGKLWLERALALGGDAPEVLRGKALLGAGTLAWTQGNYEQAGPLIEEALRYLRTAGDLSSTGQALLTLARLAWDQGDTGRAGNRFREARAHFHGSIDSSWEALCDHGLALVAFKQGDYDRAVSLFQQALSTWQAQGNSWGLACCVPGHLGDVARMQGDDERAASLYRESLALNHEHGDKENIAWLLIGLSNLAATGGQPELAARLLGVTQSLQESLDAPMRPDERADFTRATNLARSLVGEASFAAAYTAGRALTLDQGVAEALTVGVVARPIAHVSHGDGDARPLLTSREGEVLRLLLDGYTDRQIADALLISPRTVSHHVASILAKVGAKSRTAAVGRARRLGLL
ncbi:MAG: tetratricopeptide repeat protein [Chloroflexota bacterium]|nr:tetratricopeptide repeat protein [Chloroflexota bacterium]